MPGALRKTPVRSTYFNSADDHRVGKKISHDQSLYRFMFLRGHALPQRRITEEDLRVVARKEELEAGRASR